MTESEWLDETNVSQWMANALYDRRVSRTKSGRRKLRLFACGCCRLAWKTIPNKRLRDAVQTAERFADGTASAAELAAARAGVERLASDRGPYGKSSTRVRVAVDMAIATTEPGPYEAAHAMTATEAPLAGAMPESEAEAYVCDLFRCVFGNPFRPAALPKGWRTADVLGLARAIYEDRAFDRLPLLADALMDAGCGDDQVLGHCRGAGPHVRGCWVVDLVLGKG